jgi:hypothetical protein
MLTHGNGERYVGCFYSGRLEGTVRVYYNDSRQGVKFEGEFRGGKQHGHGVAFKEDGTGAEFEGDYVDGSMKVKQPVAPETIARLSGYIAPGSKRDGFFEESKVRGLR